MNTYEDTSAWIKKRVSDRRLAYLRETAENAADKSEVFGVSAAGYLNHVGQRCFAIDTSEEYDVERYLAMAFAHLPPEIMTAKELNDLCRPIPNDNADILIWQPKIDHFGELNINATASGYITIRFDTVKRTFSISVLWRDREDYRDVFAQTSAINLKTQAEVLELLRKAHTWGAKTWLEIRETLETKRLEKQAYAQEKFEDELKHLP